MSNTPGSSAVNVENTQKKILKSIDDLKKMEEELYKQLQTSGANENDVQKQQELIGRIENVSAIRKDLLNSLTDRYIDIQDNVISSRNDLVQQTAMVGIVQDELDKANANIDAISSERNNKMRMVELNTYERERYQSYMEIMKISCLAAVLVVFILILGHKNIIPSQNIVFMAVGVIVAIVGIIVLTRLLDIQKRDNLYFQKYDFPFDPTKLGHPKEGTGSGGNIGVASGTSVCANSDCCSSGQTFNTAIGKCVNAVPLVKESFIGSPYLTIDESKTVDIGYSNEVKGCDTRYNQNGNFSKF
tara:strand:+ start:179 stop:1084 length:906 start_codon:yes stop_codon:yes gene_type:complete